MTDWNPRTNGTLRGFLIILAVAVAITAAGRGGAIALGTFLLVLRIAFIVVVAIVLYRLWRSRREQIAEWPRRARVVFYGAAGVAIANVLANFVTTYPSGAAEALVFFGVLGACAYALIRTWRDQHTYGY
jgi:hypothetical protein